MISENEYEISLRADTNNPKYRLWFYFCLRNNKPGQRVLFHVVNFSKSKSLYRDGMSPTARLPVHCASRHPIGHSQHANGGRQSPLHRVQCVPLNTGAAHGGPFAAQP